MTENKPTEILASLAHIASRNWRAVYKDITCASGIVDAGDADGWDCCESSEGAGLLT